MPTNAREVFFPGARVFFENEYGALVTGTVWMCLSDSGVSMYQLHQSQYTNADTTWHFSKIYHSEEEYNRERLHALRLTMADIEFLRSLVVSHVAQPQSSHPLASAVYTKMQNVYNV
jgi:hypothetical protein